MENLLSKTILVALATMISLSLLVPNVSARSRYATPPPLILSPNMSGQLMLQLRGSPSIIPRAAHQRILREKPTYKRQKYSTRRTTIRYNRRTVALRSGVVVAKNNRAEQQQPALLTRRFYRQW